MNIEIVCTSEACVSYYYGIPLIVYALALGVIVYGIVAYYVGEK